MSHDLFADFLLSQLRQPEQLMPELRRLWEGGHGDPRRVQSQAIRVASMLRNPSFLLEHRDELVQMANGPMPIPALDLWLYEAHRDGRDMPRDAAKALAHLERAASAGDASAREMLARHLLGQPGLVDVLPEDPERAIAMLKDLAYRGGNSTDANQLIARHLIRRPPASYTSDDLNRIDFYGHSPADVDLEDLLPLARHYARRCTGTDYASEEYRFARALLIEGTKRGYRDVASQCEAQLDAWGVRPAPAPPPPPPPPPPTALQKTATVAKTTGAVAGIGLTLWVWSIIGTFLLGVAAMINAFMIPVLLGVAGLAFVVSKVRGR